MAKNTEAALIDAMQPAFGPHPADINSTLGQYDLRQGMPYLSPSHIMTADKAHAGVPYWMQGLAMQTTNNQYITAPEALQKSILTHQAGTMYGNTMIGSGQAPTSGIFTGVEDKCS